MATTTTAPTTTNADHHVNSRNVRANLDRCDDDNRAGNDDDDQRTVAARSGASW